MRLENLSVYYGRHQALSNVSVSFLKHGQVIGILGENGSGKTTLVNVLLKNINKFKGTRQINENIAYLPDRSFLYENMRISEAIKLFKDVYKDFDEERAQKILKRFGISPKLKLHECSKGMHEQVHLALTFARNTDFYILDEPLGAIDPIKRQAFIEMIENYRAQGSTVIIVTHLLRDLGDMFDEIAFLKQGKLIAYTSKRHVLDKFGSLENAYVEEMEK